MMIKHLIALLIASQFGPVADPPMQTADRLSPQIQVTATLPPPEPTGLNGMPFAPAGLSGCDEMYWYRVQAGLPSHFDGLGWRESNCKNYVSSYCCHGYWQLYVSTHLKDHRLGPRYRDNCGIYGTSDILGDNALAKQKNACGAAQVYAVQGGGAWDAW
jgi:hypothetical protein